jgi:LmbE family N-acetylglucosaminyl deacetylase/CheY-like chemotaxis protein
MRILYIFPHPDDESFGPAAAMWNQHKMGHEVHLLTLTKGGATKVRHSLGLSVEEMGEIRHKEMLDVARVLELNSFTILDFPDGKLAEIDPRSIEEAIEKHIHTVMADVIVSYPVHGISGFPDHLVTHAVVKRMFCSMREKGSPYPKRLAMFTLSPDQQRGFEASAIPVKSSSADSLLVRTEVDADDRKAMDKALDCYLTYQETIQKTMRTAPPFEEVVFELFDEKPNMVYSDICEGLKNHTNQSHDKDLKSIRLLLVEDNQINSYVVKKFLDRWNATMILAESGKDAIQMVRENKPNVILMDMDLPDMSGIDACEDIRAIDPTIPIIILSARVHHDLDQRITSLGIKDRLTKPFNSDLLYSTIKKYGLIE